MVGDGDEHDLPSYGGLVGQQLRLVRQQRRLTLQEVDQLSNGEFKASVLGAYERAERIISVLRLKRLAEFYGVPIDYLLPDTGRTEQSVKPLIDLTSRAQPGSEGDRRRAAQEAVQRPFGSGRWPRRCSRR